ncbi:hypothetical protein GCM10011512_02980 [Tersicoccus solisilvae]|uniref:Septum formation-related domain-containing protein n=1 Tax=Tersicoccus solisilvae TaxID=1882339 RepID=A0ABQ1NKX5_9MICC|nr:septum formation family protein [Tersicoccus solisilvae]GGC79754.1 hypothetical protein GCM10011512_02980 [Tersicoccus solisilvae]
MSARPLRAPAPVLALAVALTLTACAPAGSGVPRDALGRVTESARTSAWALAVGDCTAALDATGTLETVDVVPCEAPHAFEVFSSRTMTEPTFPGLDQTDDLAARECRSAFTAFVGVPPDRSRYTVLFLHPTQRSWDEQTDRELLCLAGRSSGGVTGSLKDVEE